MTNSHRMKPPFLAWACLLVMLPCVSTRVAQGDQTTAMVPCTRMTTTAVEAGALEQTTCGTSFVFRIPLLSGLVSTLVGEDAAFVLLREQAGSIADLPPETSSNVDRICLITRDRRNLHGYRIRARDPARGYVVAAQGNATLAGRLLPRLRFLADLGLDVLVLDYRGYGHSSGTPRLKAIVQDYVDLIHFVDRRRQPGQRIALYGMSFGAIVLMRSVALGAPYDFGLMDSVPSTAHRECPSYYDPVNNLPDDLSRLEFLFGSLDTQVTPAMTAALRTKLHQEKGLWQELAIGHPDTVGEPRNSLMIREQHIRHFAKRFLD